MSPLRNDFSIVRAKICSASSPPACPSRSFTPLNPSRSQTTSANSRSYRRARATSASRRSTKARRFSSRVSGSWSARKLSSRTRSARTIAAAAWFARRCRSACRLLPLDREQPVKTGSSAERMPMIASSASRRQNEQPVAVPRMRAAAVQLPRRVRHLLARDAALGFVVGDEEAPFDLEHRIEERQEIEEDGQELRRATVSLFQPTAAPRAHARHVSGSTSRTRTF